MAIAINKVLTLKRHSVLNGYAAPQRFYTLDIPVGDRFTMVKKPVEAIKRDLAVDFLVDVQDARDRLVVGRVQTERPAVRGQVADYRYKFRFHHGLHVRAHLKKVLEISSRKDEHFARAVHPVEVVPCAWLRYLCPVLKVGELFFGTLGK